jgi:hypothetical protein
MSKSVPPLIPIAKRPKPQVVKTIKNSVQTDQIKAVGLHIPKLDLTNLTTLLELDVGGSND